MVSRFSTLFGATAAIVLAALVVVGIAAQSNDYIVGSQDVLTVQVFDQADLGGKYVVEADGSIAFPLIGRVKVGGLTLRDVEALLRKELSNGFFKNPQVSVSVEQYRSQRVFIVGEVRNPGSYALTGDMTLIEALAKAGSTSGTAGAEVLIVRPRAGTSAEGPTLPPGANATQDSDSEVIHVDITDLQSGQLSQNVALRDGDTIYVPRAQLIYLAGQVKTPGPYALQKGMTVLQALSMAGGITDRGAENRIRIERLVNGRRTEVKSVKPEDPVQPGDTIVVPERFF